MDEAHAETEALLYELQLEVEREYRQAAEEMQKKLTDYQRRFGIKNKIKLKELRDDKITPKEYSDWYKGQVLIGQRWIDMRDQLATDMTHSNEIAMSTISGYLPEVYAINHNYATFDIERQSRINTSYALYNRYTVERLLKDKPKLLPRPSVRVTKDMLYNKQVLTSSVLQTVLQGEDIYRLAKRLRPEVAEKATAEYFGVNTAEALEHKLNVAAMRTARTMVTSAQNGGRYQAGKRAERMGIEFESKTWVATLDARTRDSHARLHGEERPMDEEFSNGLMYPGDENGEPEEVYNCFLADTNIASNSGIVRSYKHQYSGDIVSIKTASGVNFSCTPNHPILTSRGWISAKFLNCGDDLLVTFGSGNEIARRNPDINHAFPRIDAIHDLLYKFGGKRTRTLSVNFHGDIPTSDVEIVTHKRLLRESDDSRCRNSVDEFLFKGADKSLFCKSTFVKHFWSVFGASLSNISSLGKILSFFLRRLRHSEIHSLRPVALLYSGGVKPLDNDVARNAKLISECLNGFTGVVFADNIVSVDISSKFSHVYNLQTENGYYFVNNIIPQSGAKGDCIFAIAHNCRCTMNQHVKKTQKIDLISDFTGKYAGLSRDYIGGEDMTYQDWLDLHSEDKEIKKAAREKWKVSDIGNERKKRYYP